MNVFGCLDQLPIGVDPHHDMSTGGESGAHPSRPARKGNGGRLLAGSLT